MIVRLVYANVKMVKARKYVVKNYFHGIPKREDFEVVEYDLPPVQDQEILVKTEWISVDPYHIADFFRSPTPYDQFGYNVGVVEDSKDPGYPVGSRVVSHRGWCDRYIASTKETEPSFDGLYKLPDLEGLSNSLACGAVGMVGATAYFGLFEICQPKVGETVVVTGAAGAVGSLAGQIAKIKGCKVIGFAGSDDKVQWLEKELGFDKAFNYKTVDAHKVLKEAAPNGIDCFFDNVGGELSSIIINQMNQRGRVSICGAISTYNEDPNQLPKATIIQPAILSKKLKVEGFIVSQWIDRWPEAFADLVKWIKSGELKAGEHVTEGFDNVFDALIGLFAGDNFGKAVVKV